jgi:hypothetical protein
MVVVFNIKLNLAVGCLLHISAHEPVFSFNSNPSHASDLIINHESKSVGQVALVSGRAQAVSPGELNSAFND